MEELGIFAADRAQLYFDGHWYDVGFDDLHTLKLKGTELVIFEKEGMAETLTAVAEKYGWAILFTRGFATKYVRDLSELCKKYDGNACVLSDYDASGILLASKLKVPRIGIDPKTLEYFELDREAVEEEYDPRNHLAGIKDLVTHEEFGYLSHYRIEINSIKTKVGSKAFQDWIIYKIQTLFPYRDYNRAIELGDAVLPDKLKKQFDKVTAKIQNWQKPKCDQISGILVGTTGYIEVPKYRTGVEEELKKVVTDISEFQNFIQKFTELVDSSFSDGASNSNSEDDDGPPPEDDGGGIQAEMLRYSLKKDNEQARAEYVVKYLYENKGDKELDELDKALFNGRISVDYVYDVLKKREGNSA